MADWQPFWIFLCAICHGLYPCVRHYILFYTHGPVIELCKLKLGKFYKIKNGR